MLVYQRVRDIIMTSGRDSMRCFAWDASWWMLRFRKMPSATPIQVRCRELPNSGAYLIWYMYMYQHVLTYTIYIYINYIIIWDIYFQLFSCVSIYYTHGLKSNIRLVSARRSMSAFIEVKKMTQRGAATTAVVQRETLGLSRSAKDHYNNGG